ncbi:MAG: hypothetical protein IPN55_11350 [Saprospiraceae bacterium]|nr:hypothetical protein [Candidatus Brachybacter algidus]
MEMLEFNMEIEEAKN